MRFENRVVFVTGGASGLGLAIASRFGAEGARVVIADIALDAAREAARSVGDATAVRVDVSDPESVRQGFEHVLAEELRVDVVVNNAGIDGEQRITHEHPLENWRRVMAINADGAFHTLRYGLDALLRSGGGSVVNMASTAGLTAFPNIPAYTVAKAGLVGLTRATAIEYADRHIRVNAVAPTMVLTALVENFIENAEDPAAMRAQLTGMNPLPGAPEPADVAAAVAFLASEEARFITGVTLPVDGGYTAR
ncbi:3-oxoacyl-ACP reductase [Actinoalloteichus sp. AHMU CJ021]|uniref:NAD(P)-dependent dehydrogenase, short-chain alcohol dehydrogenase family n=1 Tax=Actinoalloteichus caeruleus DSM 43889 TaxID=1120930 RepID=A0ABT1JIP4_ACTCY|nr:glucose 1-dehydrogenase [Actinoalloteichus caeruleus]AUS78048.1 3-oxoacyl-ACP reductase [Actinoalloteichus sp. AHMU CJ021]MCP2332038.1 NAD(P)-dependent dehydrogenase, short-chain alcohol dehydrogenase family [Actinoalloteichus caeruleus DSM 43889]